MDLAWSPGIGDPSIGGWITVILYFVAAVSCLRIVRTIRRAAVPQADGYFVWLAFAVLFVGLGLNKQLDLQSAFTEIGRVVAIKFGWYDQRVLLQIAFIVLIGVIVVATLLGLAIQQRKAPAPTLLACFGVAFVLGFLFIRAVSFHFFDYFIGMQTYGLRWNWILEIGGIVLVLAGSWWRHARLTGLLRSTESAE